MRKILIFLIFARLFSPAAILAESRCLKVHFMDVGEGEAVLIKAPGAKAILIDSGNCLSGAKVAGYLKRLRIRDIGHLIFTHTDLDHIGGGFFILQTVKAENVYDNGQDLTRRKEQSDIYRWYERGVRKHKGYKPLKVRDLIRTGQLRLKVISPPQPFALPGYNSNSLVLMLEYGKFRCLFTGDLDIAAEKLILETKTSLNAAVLKVGHHGAADSTCAEFLERISPQIAVLSVDKANIRGYPSDEVLTRLNKAGIRLYRTDRDGDIVLSVYPDENNGFRIELD